MPWLLKYFDSTSRPSLALLQEDRKVLKATAERPFYVAKVIPGWRVANDHCAVTSLNASFD
jgi:hypothetical protein